MKRQTLTYKKDGTASLEDMKSDIRQKMSNVEIAYLYKINESAKVIYDWNNAENKMTITRTWNNEDYDDYITNWSDLKTFTVARLKDNGYQITETIEEIS